MIITLAKILALYLLILGNCYAKNVVLILTDDQDIHLKSVEPMTNVRERIADQGAVFENAFVTTPICCPSRSSILTGFYAHNHGTLNNSATGGCGNSSKEFETITFGNILHSAGYKTFYAGKYLNEYGILDKHVPLGWDWWIGLVGNSAYYNYSLVINGTDTHFGNNYLTDVIRDYALDFLNQIDKTPFLMVLAPPAPHAPFTPADRHKSSLPNVKAVETPAFNYTLNENKHWLLRMSPIPLPTSAKSSLDQVQRKRLQTLLAVDELVGDVITKLNSTGILDETYVIYTSDNGYHIGQFSQMWDKRQPYDTDTQVPLFIRGPKIKPKTLISHPVANIDFASTIIDMAGVKSELVRDGMSFLNFLEKPEDGNSTRTLLIEYFGEASPKSVSDKCPWKDDTNLAECSEEFFCKCQDARNNTYSCVRHISPNDNILMCNFDDDENFIEMYNVNGDRYQLYNLAHNNAKTGYFYGDFYEALQELKTCVGASCHKMVL